MRKEIKSLLDDFRINNDWIFTPKFIGHYEKGNVSIYNHIIFVSDERLLLDEDEEGYLVTVYEEIDHKREVSIQPELLKKINLQNP